MYIPPVTHDTVYTGPYNVDYRKWNDMYPDWFKCFGEKDFINNPLGHMEGTCDRYHHRVLKLKWINQLRVICFFKYTFIFFTSEESNQFCQKIYQVKF